MKKIRLFTSYLLFIAITQNTAFAFPTAFVSIDGIAVFANTGKTQAIALFNTLGNTYIPNKKWQNYNSLMIGAGVNAYKNHDIEINTGLRYLPTIEMPTHGDVLQLHSERFRNLRYSYNVTSSIWLADNTITWTKHKLQPGLILGIGAALNKTSNYHEEPLNNHTAPSLAPFANNHNTAFAYELGAALDYAFDQFIIECAYRSLNAGQTNLGLSSLQNTETHLSTGTLYYNIISLGVRYHHYI